MRFFIGSLAVLISFVTAADQRVDARLNRSVAAPVERKAAGELVKKLGVSAYDLQVVDEGTVRVVPIRAGSTFATTREVFEFRDAEAGVTDVDYRDSSGNSIAVRWSQRDASLTITDGSESVTVTWDSGAKAFAHTGSDELFRRTRPSTTLLGAVLTDLMDRGAIGRRNAKPPQSQAPDPATGGSGEGDGESIVMYPDPPPDTTSGGGGSGVTCSSDEYRAEGFGNTASYACRNATQDVNYKCSNCACMGCCKLYDCDTVCALGDYFCMGARSGLACTRVGLGCS